MSIRTLIFMAVLASSPVLQAKPLDERQVAADARWLLHVDLDALRESGASAFLVTQWLQARPIQNHLDGIREAIGLDVTKDLHGITLYGEKLVPDRGAVVARASLDPSRVMAFLARQSDYEKQEIGGHEVLSWVERRGGEKHTVFGAMLGPEGMVFSRDVDDLAAALAVLDGKAASLADSESPLKGPAPVGAVVLVRACGLSEAQLPLKSPILRLSEILSLAAGEEVDGAAFVEVRLTAASEKHVAEFHDVAVGLVALARLMRDNDEDVLRLLDAVAIRTEDRTVVARWSGQWIDVIKAVGNEHFRKHTMN